MIPKSVKQAVLERSGGLCEICRSAGDFRGLMLHHKKVKGMGGVSKESENPKDYIALCGRCHSREHGIREARR